MLQKILFALGVLLAANAYTIPLGPIPLPVDAQLKFVCGPFMNNGKATNYASETQIYFSHYFLAPDGANLHVYLVYDGNIADTSPLDPDQAANLPVPPSSNATVNFNGSAPETLDPNFYLAKVSIAFGENNQPLSASLSVIKLSNDWATVAMASCLLQK